MVWLKIILAAVVAFLKAWFGLQPAQDKFAKQKAHLKQLERDIEDAKKDLADAINLGEDTSVNEFSTYIERMRKEWKRTNAELPAELQKSDCP